MEKEELEWFDNPSFISNILIGIIMIAIIISQSFMTGSDMPVFNTLGSTMNHNSIYLFILFYLIALKTNTGKRSFNYLNLGVIIIYVVAFVASFLTIFQSFGIIPLLNLSILMILSIYLFHSLLRNTRWEKELSMKKSPFNEITNDGYFVTLLTLVIITLLITLIEAVSFDVVVLSLIDAIYLLMLVRFIYLYNEYLNSKELKKGNAKNIIEKVGKADE